MGKKTPAICGQKCSGSSASAALQSFLASRLKARFGMGGLMEYSETWKEKTTPAGRTYWAHTASVRRTSDKGYTGWPTPQACQGPNNSTNRGKQHGGNRARITPQNVTDLVGWANPTVRDHKDTTSDGTVEINGLLGRQVWLSRVPTESRGALNPAFILWLMGYPDEWVCSGARAMQSCRKSPQNL